MVIVYNKGQDSEPSGSEVHPAPGATDGHNPVNCGALTRARCGHPVQNENFSSKLMKTGTKRSR